jgi:TPR repeat protein
MRNLTATICLTIVVLLGSAGSGWSADFKKGYAAHESGDYATALSEWTPLAENKGLLSYTYSKEDVASAQNNLGEMYAKGQGVSQDHKTAFKWYTLAAEQGYANAMFNLGAMYAKGQGVPQAYKTAIKWYTLAAEQGHATAQYHLAQMYRKGQGVPQNYKVAVHWYTLAAEQGHASARRNLGMR